MARVLRGREEDWGRSSPLHCVVQWLTGESSSSAGQEGGEVEVGEGGDLKHSGGEGGWDEH